MAGNDGFLYTVPSDDNPNDGRLTDPTLLFSPASVGSGALSCSSASLSGVAVSISTGTGSLVSSNSTITGHGTVTTPFFITGEGALFAQSSTITGNGISSSSGSGTLTDQNSSLVGTGRSLSTGTGSLNQSNSSLHALGTVAWFAKSHPYLDENGLDFFLLEDGSGFYLREEIQLLSSSSQISGSGQVVDAPVFRGMLLGIWP